MGTYDARFKRLADNPRFVLINNYKCGFSSSNLLPHEPVAGIAPEDEVIFFYRNVFLRAISVFINWTITDDRYVREEGWLMENLKRELSASWYARFLDLLRARKYVDTFRAYVDALERIFDQNDHTLPQVTVLSYYGVERVDHFVELEHSERFFDITSIHFPYDHTNRSRRKIKGSLIQHLVDDESQQEHLRRIYQADLDFQARHDLECVRLQALGLGLEE